jgi:hypothetical protein
MMAAERSRLQPALLKRSMTTPTILPSFVQPTRYTPLNAFRWAVDHRVLNSVPRHMVVSHAVGAVRAVRHLAGDHHVDIAVEHEPDLRRRARVRLALALAGACERARAPISHNGRARVGHCLAHGQQDRPGVRGMERKVGHVRQ